MPKKESFEIKIRVLRLIVPQIDMYNTRKGTLYEGVIIKSWNRVIRNTLKLIGLTENMVQDRSLWGCRTKVADHRLCPSNPSFNCCLNSDCCYVILGISLVYV